MKSRSPATALKALTSSKSNEWYTPLYVMLLVKQLLGVIDLDPASCAIAQEIVGAAAYFTKADNGLTKRWSGRVWLNPPYGGAASSWILKALKEFKRGHISEALILVRGDSEALKLLMQHFAFCECDRISFINPADPSAKNPVPGTKIFFLCRSGKREQDFATLFNAIGVVCKKL